MKAVMHIDVPEWQIGQEVSCYFPDTMTVKAVCEKDTSYKEAHDDLSKNTEEAIIKF